MQDTSLLSVSELFVILFRRKWVFLLVWILIMTGAIGYLLLAKKTYRLKGSIFVGKIQRFLVEEGEFVAKKLEDYSFVKRALDAHQVVLDIPVSRQLQNIQADVVNEVKKDRDVGIVELTVEYKDQQICFDIFKALTDELIKEHKVLVDRGHAVFNEMEKSFLAEEERVRQTLNEDDLTIRDLTKEKTSSQFTAPSGLLLAKNMEDRRQYLKEIIRDRHYLQIEGDAATTTFNTKLAATPVVPDEPYKPKRLTILIIAIFVATIAGVISAFAWHLLQTEIRPKLGAKS